MNNNFENLTLPELVECLMLSNCPRGVRGALNNIEFETVNEFCESLQPGPEKEILLLYMMGRSDDRGLNNYSRENDGPVLLTE